MNDILSQLGVRLLEGDLLVDLQTSNPTDISDAIFRLSQACLRLSDFAAHQRLRSANAFRDDVEEFFEAHNFNYQVDVKILGSFGKEVRVDFEVSGERRKSYVCVLASTNESAAHAAANEIFGKWYDIRKMDGSTHELITIYNSASSSVFREDDIGRLREFSNWISYPEEEDYLAAFMNGSQAVPASA